MRPEAKSRLLFSRGATAAACLLAVLAGLAASGRSCLAADEFQQLVNQIPRSANAVVLLNMEKAKQSPLGLKEDWKTRIEKAFEDGLIRVPPQATRFVLASQMDFEFKEPLWEAAVIDLDDEFSMQQIAQDPPRHAGHDRGSAGTGPAERHVSAAIRPENAGRHGSGEPPGGGALGPRGAQAEPVAPFPLSAKGGHLFRRGPERDHHGPGPGRRDVVRARRQVLEIETEVPRQVGSRS